MSELKYIDLKKCAFKPALELQHRLWEQLTSGVQANYLLLVEHDPPVITLGRSAKPCHLLAPREQLVSAGIEVHSLSRGGSATWHGPGQLVGYPIMRMGRQGLHGYVWAIEQAIIRLAAELGIAACRRKGLTGVWVGNAKFAAIGVAVKRWVAYHGFCLNVSADLRGFDFIIPCGLAGQSVTSLERLLGKPLNIEKLKPLMAECLRCEFGLDAVVQTEIPQASTCGGLDIG